MTGLNGSDYINKGKQGHGACESEKSRRNKKFDISVGKPKMPIRIQRREQVSHVRCNVVRAHTGPNYGPRSSVWAVTPCGPVAGYTRFGGTYRLHLQVASGADEMTLPNFRLYFIQISLCFIYNRCLLC
jgi:hypothetical protein